MDFDFINNIRLSLENENIFKYAIIGAKTCALLLLIFSILEKWGKNILGENNVYNDLFNILGYAFLIMSSDFIFNQIELTFSVIDSSVGNTNDTMYADLLSTLEENYFVMTDGAETWKDLLSAVLTNMTFFVGYGITLLLMGIVRAVSYTHLTLPTKA